MDTLPLSESSDILRAYAHSVKDIIYKPARGILRYPYLSASVGPTYVDTVDWDAVWAGCFYLREGDPEPLKSSLLNYIEHIAPDGKGQRRIGFKKYSAPPYQNRPLIVSGCWALSQVIGVQWLSADALDRLHAQLEYWHIHRRGREGLLKWLHVDEGFADNGMANWSWEPLAVQAVDLSAQLVREHLSLAWIMEQANDPRSAKHREYAAYLTHRIEHCLWDEEDGCYYALYNPPERWGESTFIKERQYLNMWPLWVGITPPDRAKRVIEKYLLSEDEFNSPFGVRSLSKASLYYNNMRVGFNTPMHGAPHTGPVAGSRCANWQGPVWVPATFIGIEILYQYGYHAEAEDFATRHLSNLAKLQQLHGGVFECFDAETGAGMMESALASWNLPISMVHEYMKQPLFLRV